MREIKFCIGVKNESGEVSEVILTIDELLDKGLKCDGCEILYKRQFIGVKDINGVDIYEGDSAICYDYAGNLEVRFHTEWPRASFGLFDSGGDHVFDSFCGVEVINKSKSL